MICDKCNNHLCIIRTKLEKFHDDIDCMSVSDKDYYCDEMISILEQCGVSAREVNFNVEVNDCYREDKRIFKEG